MYTQERVQEEGEEASCSKPAGSRGSSAHSTASRKSKASRQSPQSSKRTTSAHSRASTAEIKSKSVTPEEPTSRASSTHSRQTSRSKEKEVSIGRLSKQSTPTPNHSRPSTAPGSGTKLKEGSRVQSRVSSAASSTRLSRHQLGLSMPQAKIVVQQDGGSGRQSLSTAELRAEAIRSDLHK